MSDCDCSSEITKWIDAFQGFGPITRWRQYQASSEGRVRRSAEMRTIRVDERAELIRNQIALIRENCRCTEGDAA